MRRTGRWRAAADWLDRAASLVPASFRGPLLLERARLARWRGDLEEMARWVARMESLEPAGSLVGQALWELGREGWEAGETDLALEALRRLTRRSGARRRQEAAVTVGVLLFAVGRDGEALQWWDSLGVGPAGRAARGWPKLDVRPDLLARAWYWRGRVLEALGEREGALRAWERAARVSPREVWGWLALRAAHALEETGSSQSLWPRWRAEVLGNAPPGPRGAGGAGDSLAVLLARQALGPALWRMRLWRFLGLDRWAVRELQRWERRGRSLLERLAFRLLGGDAAGALRLGFRLRPDSLRLRFTHPSAFPEAVLEASGRFGLSPFLLWAVMRQESAMDPGAVSRAGARGLLQLMPETARATAQRCSLQLRDLHDPRENVLLGAAHLRELLDAGLGLAEALAAYNAGREAVARWRRPGEAPDLFLERIGYAETRGYVRRVLRDYEVFRTVYGSVSSRRLTGADGRGSLEPASLPGGDS
jgi:soluble lytic murein transglycosylase-like protein